MKTLLAEFEKQCAFAADCRAAVAPAAINGGTICAACEKHFQRTLEQLRYDYIDLCANVVRGNAPNDVRISRPKPASTPPSATHITALRDDIVSALLWCEYLVRDLHRQRNTPGAVRQGYAVDRAVAYLAPRTALVADLGDLTHLQNPGPYTVEKLTGLDVLEDFDRFHRAAGRHLGITVRKVRMPGICTPCSTHTLTRFDGHDEVFCQLCDHVTTLDEYEAQLTLPPPVTQHG